MADAKDKKKQLHHVMRDISAPWGFKFDAKEKMFVRRSEGKYDLFTMPIALYGNLVKVKCMAAVGIEEMEAISRHTRMYGFPPKYSFSVARDVVGAGQNSSYEIDFSPGIDIGALGNKLKADLESVGFPLYEQFKTTADIDKELNEDPSERSDYFRNEVHRCFSGTIAAHLSHRGNYDRIVETYRNKLKHWAKGFYVPAYEDLLVVLGTK